MKIQTLGIVSVLAIVAGTQAFAADVSGEVSLDATTNATDDIVITPGVDLSIGGDVAMGSIGLTVDSATDNVKLDSYSVGVHLGTDATLSFGDQGDLLGAFEGSTETVGGQTLLNLDDSGESIALNMGKLSAGLRFNDIGTDATDLAALQATYGTEIGAVGIAAGVDYNIDTEEASTFAAVNTDLGGIGLGGTLTYRDKVAYEASASYGAIGTFLNGDEDDALQNIGGGVYGSVAGTGMSYYAEAGYNIDSEEITPAAGIAFKF